MREAPGTCLAEAARRVPSEAGGAGEAGARVRRPARPGARDLPRAIAGLAHAALLAELYATPKPGLVDLVNNGAHTDLSVGLFEASARSLRPYFAHCARMGWEWPPGEDAAGLFPGLRAAGQEAEAAMFAATRGVNTHKGALFSLGLLAASAAGTVRQGLGLEALEDFVRRLCAGLVQRDFAGLAGREPRTAGERFYLRLGVAGVRGEAEAGFPVVVRAALPLLEGLLAAGRPFGQACVRTLLHLMARVDDTNVLSRAGLDGLRYVRACARDLERRCGLGVDPAAMAELDAHFTARRISPGGSADLLAAACFLHFLRRRGLLGGAAARWRLAPGHPGRLQPPAGRAREGPVR